MVERRYKCQQFLFYFVVNILSITILIDVTGSTPVKGESRRKSLSSASAKSGFEEIGWQAWLLVDNQGNLPSRRISPKSIFIAPPACAEGYQPDTMNRCVKTVNINQEAHIDFILQQLNTMYANFDSQPNSDASSASTGPLQVNIPLLIDTNVKDETNQENNDDATKISLLPVELDNTEKEGDKMKENDETVLMIYENVKNDSSEFEQLIPVMEFVEEVNSNYSDVVDYKTSIIMDRIYNKTENENVNVESDDKLIEKKSNETLEKVNTSIQPTLLLLLSPTIAPITNLTDEIKLNDNMSLKRATLHVGHGENASNSEGANGNNLTTEVPPTTLTTIKFVLNTSDSPADITTKPDDKVYDDDYTEDDIYKEKESIDDHTKEYEESTENDDEILTHSEAGMMVTISPTIFPHYATTFSESKENESKISGEVMINRDFVRETTLVGLNINKKNSKLESEKNLEIVSNKELPENIDKNNDDVEKSSSVFDEITETITDKTATLPVTTEPIMSRTDLRPSGIIVEKIPKESISTQQMPSTTYSTMHSIIFPKNTDEIQFFFNKSNTKVSEIMTASSSNAAEIIMQQKSDDLPKNNAEIQESQNKLLKSQKIEVKFPSTNQEQSNTYNYYPVSQEYLSNNRYSTAGDSNAALKPVNEQRSDANKNFGVKKNELPNYFGQQIHPMRDKNYVHFPPVEKPQDWPNYVKFPLEEANSIHAPNYFKEKYYNRQYSPPNYYQTPPKLTSEFTTSTKQVAWPSTSNRRVNRQQSSRLTSGQNQKKKQNRSPIVGFWARMPLFQDPSSSQQSMHPLLRTDSSEYPITTRTDRKVHFYKEITPLDVTRSYARSLSIRR